MRCKREVGLFVAFETFGILAGAFKNHIPLWLFGIGALLFVFGWLPLLVFIFIDFCEASHEE
jgi:hypothetical protein